MSDTAILPAAARTDELVTARGETTISPTVIARIAKRAATEVDGVELVSGGGIRGLFDALRTSRTPGTNVDVAARHTAVELTLAVAWPRPVGSVTDAVRLHVRSRVQELTGYEVTDVDIKVDALPAPAQPGRVR